jgi:uncharacterized protein
VHESRDEVTSVRDEQSWPLPETHWTAPYHSESGHPLDPPTTNRSITFDTRKGGARIGWTMTTETELTGPMALRLGVSVEDASDVDLVVGIEKWIGNRYVPFEGSYGFGRGRVATVWLRASARQLDSEKSRPFAPVPDASAPSSR